jgi:rhomboid protease GluP
MGTMASPTLFSTGRRTSHRNHKIVVEDDRTEEEKAREEERQFERDLEHEIPHAYAMLVLMGANVAVYVLMALDSGRFWEFDLISLLRWGANYGPLTVDERQWWRIVASTFLHAGFAHIALNMLAFWTSAHIVERLYGPRWFVFLYALSGLGASLASLWHHPGVPSVGASGAIVGVYGCLLAFHLHANPVLSTATRNTEIKSLLGFFAYLLVAGFRDRAIDTVAHIAGALIGFAMGFMYARWLEPRLPHVAAATAISPPGRSRARQGRGERPSIRA